MFRKKERKKKNKANDNTDSSRALKKCGVSGK